ncbi:MAG TPA: M28 family peptidase [Planctomycetota bacterium]|nr:M28 family peptidase [Planctomycetota bacterium]
MSASRLLALLLSLIGTVFGQGTAKETPQQALEQAPKAALSITAKDLRAHVETLASDAYEGRLTGTRGHRKAIAYIADQFQKYGLEPFGQPDDKGEATYLHTYDIVMTEVKSGSGLFQGNERVHEHSAWVMPTSYRSGERILELEGPLYFLGTPARRQGDLEIPEGHIPVLVLDMDTSRDGKVSIEMAFSIGMQQVFGQIRTFAAAARRAKAPGLVVLTRAYNVPFQCSMTMLGLFENQPMVSLKAGAGDFSARMMAPDVPTLVLAGKDADAVLKALALDPKQAFEAEAKNETSKKRFSMKFQAEQVPGKAANVVAILRGTDPKLREEAIVYSAHNDHVGMGPGGVIFNGADDNGSGTATLMELAQAYSKLQGKDRPKRSIIFLSVSGEELGLWGSEAWAKDAPWPTEKTIANINIDMIGRSTEKVPESAISVTPTHTHKAYSSLAREAAFLGQALNLSMESGDRFYSRSDHFNFAKRGIPVVFFCDDEHPDYHMPSDTADRLEYEKMERVARLAFLLGYRTQGREGRPEVLGRREEWGLPGDQ